jgi:hypothetical protein
MMMMMMMIMGCLGESSGVAETGSTKKRVGWRVVEGISC